MRIESPRRLALGVVVLLVLASSPAWPEMPAEGMFEAARACPALQSIRKSTNPGDVTTQPGASYRIIAKNQKKPTHYRIEVPGADPAERWVAADCGSAALSKVPSPQAPQQPHKPAGTGASYVLALSWQPAFCEAHARKPECRSQANGRFDASHFTLHGLWPQPGTNVYCGVNARDRQASSGGSWRDLPLLRLELKTQAALEQAMPGTASFLDRHEWTKHGTCYPARNPDAYFRDSLRLLEAVNASPVRDLMAGNIGKSVSVAEIRARFDEAFGPGAGERVRIACREDGRRRLIAELTLGLRGDIPAGASLSDLMLASEPTDAGCPGGVVDPAGPQ